MSSNSNNDLAFIINMYMNGTEEQKNKLKELTTALTQPTTTALPAPKKIYPETSASTSPWKSQSYVPPAPKVSKQAPQVVVHIPEGPVCRWHSSRSASKSCDKCSKYCCASCLHYVQEKDCCSGYSGQSKSVCYKCREEVEQSNYHYNCGLCTSLLLLFGFIIGILIYAVNTNQTN